MKPLSVLLAGESWVSNSTHFKGWDFFSSTVYETGTEYLEKELSDGNFTFEHMPGHMAAAHFPTTLGELEQYDAVILSDLGANTLLLHPDTWQRGKSVPNRLKLLREWVEQGGGLAMCGGYLSFAGIYGSAKYYRTPIEDILPVNIHTFDDRLEAPEGVIADVVDPQHPIVSGISGEWPYLLGFNELTLKPDGHLIARAGDHPLLAVRQFGKGRTLIWASDIGPHWCPEPFLKWEGYGRIWRQALQWLAGSTS
ncbi:MAG: glutamine amidotransferase [Anaerolineae bacterium]